ncbi:OLC1v1015615C1 [Oldenlandia corymbosa var. corymbosa]|uniref:OLC1v1015615C1 n=1 Tax=Oldenlandia corymbosa var. corymbosa TaxID=529605 RepID=A0AAV1E6S2_OLDCO|nr:OLC1v1015615C1 [Oldenlandia corymbosa var. corymbosa]
MAGLVGGVKEVEVGRFWNCRTLSARVWVRVEDPLVPGFYFSVGGVEGFGYSVRMNVYINCVGDVEGVHDDASFKMYTAVIRAHRYMLERRFTRFPESYVQEFNVRYLQNQMGWMANGFRYELILAGGSLTPLMLEARRNDENGEVSHRRQPRLGNNDQASGSARSLDFDEGTSTSPRRRGRSGTMHSQNLAGWLIESPDNARKHISSNGGGHLDEGIT